MNHRGLQPRWFLNGIERSNFTKPTTGFQWWYFDFLLADGTVIIIAFTPQQWWPSKFTSDVSRSMLFVSIRHPNGQIRERTVTASGDTFFHSDGFIKSGNAFSIEKKNDGYEILINTHAVSGSIRVDPTVAPFAASPFGGLPPWLVKLFGQERMPIAYTSFVPRGSAQVHLDVDEMSIRQSGIAYHEQGRFQGTTQEFQFESWFWFHVLGGEWTIFGAENTFLYMTNGIQIIQHAYPMGKESYSVSKKGYRLDDSRIIRLSAVSSG